MTDHRFASNSFALKKKKNAARRKIRGSAKRPVTRLLAAALTVCLLLSSCALLFSQDTEPPAKADASQNTAVPFGVRRRVGNLLDASAEACLIHPQLCSPDQIRSLPLALANAVWELPTVSRARLHHDELQEMIENTAQQYGAVGVQAAVIENGVVTDVFAWGWATLNTDPMTADHKIRVASISKVVLAMAAMCLWEEGVIDPDEDIGRYWNCTVQNPAYPDTPVTIRSILSHTSSIYCAPDNVSLSFSSVQKALKGSGYSRALPGDMDSWCYNNYAFDVLGITLELASDQAVDDVLWDHFYNTMDIDAAFAAGDIRDTDKLATLYRGGSVSRSVQNLKARHCRRQPSDRGSHFCGTLTISARDLAKLVAVLAGDGIYEGLEVFSPDSVELMETICEQPASEGFYQALPLRLRYDLYGRDSIYYHTGSAYGVYNCVSYDPDTGDGVVVLTVGASGARDENGIYKICSAVSGEIYSTLAASSQTISP